MPAWQIYSLGKIKYQMAHKPTHRFFVLFSPFSLSQNNSAFLIETPRSIFSFFACFFQKSRETFPEIFSRARSSFLFLLSFSSSSASSSSSSTSSSNKEREKRESASSCSRWYKYTFLSLSLSLSQSLSLFTLVFVKESRVTHFFSPLTDA